jgi:hypothetical protein
MLGMRGAFATYEHLLHRQPLAVKTCMGVVLAASGDIAAQRIQHDEKSGLFKLDKQRLLAFSTFGAFWTVSSAS